MPQPHHERSEGVSSYYRICGESNATPYYCRPAAADDDDMMMATRRRADVRECRYRQRRNAMGAARSFHFRDVGDKRFDCHRRAYSREIAAPVI